MKIKNYKLKIPALLIFVIIGLATGIVAVRAWTNPSNPPPSGGGAIYYSNGNVGIGTTGPQRLLHISKTSLPEFAMSNTGLGADLKNWQIQIDANGKMQFMSVNDAWSSSVNGPTLDRSGNVGIGTTAPGQKLSVAGVIESTSGGLKFPDATTQTTAYLGGSQTLVAGNVAQGQFGSNTGGGTYSFPGNVGIGTTAPGGILDVYRATGVGLLDDAIRVHRPGSYGQYAFMAYAQGSSDAYFGSVYTGSPGAYGQMYFRQYGQAGAYRDAMFIRSDGNVGIGTTGPGAKLTVAANEAIRIQDADPYISFYNAAGSVRSGYFQLTTGGGGNIDNEVQGGYWRLATKPAAGVLTERIRIDSNGNVGIGTASPGYKLDVSGDARVTGTLTAGAFSGNGSGLTNVTASSIPWSGITGKPASITQIQDHTGTYTSLNISGSAGVYSGIYFTDVSGKGSRLMVHNTSDIQGFYQEGVGWSWYFQNGALTAGTVPWGQVTGFTGDTTPDTIADDGVISTGETNFTNQSLNTTNDVTFNRVYGTADIRAPIFYDSISPGYYVDPNGNTNLSSFQAGGGTLINWPGYGNHLVQYYGSYIYPGLNNSAAWNTSYYLAGSTAWGLYTNTSMYFAGGGYSQWGFEARDNQFGNLQLATYQGALTGYPSSYYPVLKSSGTWIYFDAGGRYVGYWGNNAGQSYLEVTGGGKINAGTVDPIYTIGGIRYATYLPGMTGQQEETTGIINLQDCPPEADPPSADKPQNCKFEIDFGKAEKDSDLWLFWSITDFGKNWDKLTALLTPSFDGKVWYEKKPDEKKMIIYGRPASTGINQYLEVSYRLTAPRFDHDKWPTFLGKKSGEPHEGDGIVVEKIVNEK